MSPEYSVVLQFIDQHPILIGILLIWTLVWKGLALWKSARISRKDWFVLLLLLQTVGILDIIFLYFVGRDYEVLEEVKENK